jgi:signal peptidase I
MTGSSLPAMDRVWAAALDRWRQSSQFQAESIEGGTAADSPEMTLREILIGKSLGRTLIRGLVVAALMIAASKFVLVPVRAHGISMLPTYQEGEFIFVNRLAYRFSPVKRGDVVAIRLKGEDSVLVKRIIALPGETVRIVGGQVIIDGFPLEEPYRRYHLPWEMKDDTVAANEVFVIGDNRSMSIENHSFGFARQDAILGRAIY